MLNMIRMYLYRMLRTKSMYIIWIVMTAAVIFSTSMSRLDMKYINEEAQKQQTEGIQASEEQEQVNVGMSVSLPTQPGEKVTVADQIFANLQSKFMALFMVIFAVLFSGADVNSGYIKNIGGQVRSRGNLIFSRAIALFLYSVFTMILYLGLQIVAQKAYFGYLEWGNGTELLKYFAAQTMLHYALVLICMAITVIVNSNVVSMVISVCLTMNLMAVIYGAADHLIHKMGAESFRILDYTVTGKITLLSMSPTNKECLTAVVIAAVFGIVVTILTGEVFRKRDI